MEKNILSLTKKLIYIKSVEKNPKSLGQALELVLKELKNFKIDRFEKNGVKSALVYNSQNRPKKFRILFNVHLDVIPAKDSQFKPKIIGSKLYGAGSMDMKANASCIVFAFKEMARKVNYPIGIQLTTDEEIGGYNGTRYQIEKGVRAGFVLASEPTNFDIVHKAKGVLQLKISTIGLTAHGAYPWRGENAIEKMNTFLCDLNKKLPNPKKESWVTTMNISKIGTTNGVFNKIPDDCYVLIDVRYIKEDEYNILKEIRKIVPKDFKLEIVARGPAVATPKDNIDISLLQKVIKKNYKNKISLRGAHGTSDVSHFAKINCPGIEFGPIGGGIGSDKEWVDIPSLKIYYKIIKDFLESLNR